MARVKNHTKVKEPIRLRMKPLSDGSKSLYLDIYRDGKRTYEYLKMYIIPETDNNARRQNQVENIKSLDPLLYSKLTHQKNIRIK